MVDEPESSSASIAAPTEPTRLGVTFYLPFVLFSFAANSLITRHVVSDQLFDAGLLSGVRFLAGAAALVVICIVRRERVVIGRPNLRPALWLGVYAVSISYGYRHIGAAAGTFVFYASVLLTLITHDLSTGAPVPLRRGLGAALSLAGIVVLTFGSIGTVTALGVGLLAATGLAWGLYTAAGRTGADPRVATTGHFLVLAAALVVPTALGAVAGLHTSAAGLAWATTMGAGTTALAYVAWYACQRSMSATTAGSVQLVIPVLTAAGAVVFLGEELSMTLLIAAALVGAGMWFGNPSPSWRR
ncbi:MAG: DMT family transporter [Humibacillus sp.]|nr:DMT family transporter [Humibacillus sp.]MDN5777774.1 DMT family transporter [Humibacillus sp.]